MLPLLTAQPFPTIRLMDRKFRHAKKIQVEFSQHEAQHDRAMISIDDDYLPRSELTYLAFRVSFQETLERIVLSRQVNDASGVFGFLTEVPFLRGVAPHVQLDILAECWHRHRSRRKFQATLIDESIIYAVCETAARIAEDEPTVITHGLITGPKTTRLKVDAFLSGELRNLHLSLANEGDFLLISQFEDMNPDDARELKMQFGLEEHRLDSMFEVLGRWTVEPGMGANLNGLLTEREIVRAGFVINEVLQPRTARD
jgi:hypothetical protein